jgi:outer membrane lipoprotein-sorting protein
MKTVSIALLLTLLILSTLRISADEKADRLLKEVSDTYKATQTLTGNIAIKRQNKGEREITQGTVKLKKPDMAHIEFDASMLIISDGKTVWGWNKKSQRYVSQPVGPQLKGIELLLIGGIELIRVFFEPLDLAQYPLSQATRRYVGKRKLNGQTYQVLEFTMPGPLGKHLFYIGADKLIHRTVSEFQSGRVEASLTQVQINKSLSAATFTFKPPKTAKATDLMHFFSSSGEK